MFCIGVIPVYTPKRSQWIHFSKSSIEENSGLTYITVVKWYFISKLFYNFTLVRDWVKAAQLCLTLCDPMNYTVHGILQARKLECVAVLSSRGPSQPSDRTQISHIAGRFFTGWAIREDSEIEHYLYFSSKKFIFLSQKNCIIIGDHVLTGLWHENYCPLTWLGIFSIILIYFKSTIKVVTKGLRCCK